MSVLFGDYTQSTERSTFSCSTEGGRTDISHRFACACDKAGVPNARFHDLRHTFATNARRAGIDYFRIMAISGHKTMLVIKRYHTIDVGALAQAMRQMDTHMDTITEIDTRQPPVRP